jgi:MFS transporter, ACS family, D-galactonate transporter
MSATPAVPNRRWRIGVLLSMGVLVNYIDRINLSVATTQIRQEFALDEFQLGLLLSGFFWSYALVQLPVGLLLDRFGVALVGRVSSMLWSVASLLVAFATNFWEILLARVILGIAEAPCFPANAKATGYWFPRAERGVATAIFDAAAKFSNVIGVPLIALIAVNFGWRWGFGFSALLSALYGVAFFVVYRDPSADRKLTPAESALLLKGGATSEGRSEQPEFKLLGRLLRSRKVWGLTIGFSAYGYCFYFLLTWLPSYLVSVMHRTILTSAGYAAIPWLAATVADLAVGGWLVDALIRRGYRETRVRKTVLVAGMTAGLAVFGAVVTQSPIWSLVWISVALAGLAAAAPVGWSLPALIAPKGGVASLGSIMNFFNNLIGGLAPVLTGIVVWKTGSFRFAFLVAGLFLIVGVAAYAFLMGEISPLSDAAATPDGSGVSRADTPSA